MNAFKLYISADPDRHQPFIAALRCALKTLFNDQFRLDVFNLMENVDLAVQDEILVTPTLIKTEPAPVQRFVGDFHDPVVLAKLLNPGVGSAGL